MIPWAHPTPQHKGHLDRFGRFAQLTAGCPYTLQWDAPFPVKFARSHGGSGTPSNKWFPGPTQVHIPNGILIGSAVFAWLTGVTDRQTDRPTDHAIRSVAVGLIYVRITAMRPCISRTAGARALKFLW